MGNLRYFLGTTLFVLVAAAMLNFSVDPAGIYQENRVSPQGYADALLKSEHGLWVPENAFNDRLVSKALAKYSERFECIVIGSSHVMQISSDRAQRSLKDECRSLLNLGVTGAGIEDHITLTFLALQHGKPKKIILGIDPWTLAFGKDNRWVVFKDDYVQARAKILEGKGNEEGKITGSGGLAKLANLINLEYTLRSLHTVVEDFNNVPPKIEAALKIDPSEGGDRPVQLRDGSHVYSKEFISNAARTPVPIGGIIYGTNGVLNEPLAIEAYRALIIWIKAQKVEPIILFTPYHENVWKSSDSLNTVAMRSTEPIVTNLAHKLNIKLIGSYDPSVFGCKNEEFYDFMHPSAACLAKLRLR